MKNSTKIQIKNKKYIVSGDDANKTFQLSQKANIDLNLASDIIDKPDQTRIAIDKKNNIIKYNIKDSPLILQQFSTYKRITNNEFVGTDINKPKLKIREDLDKNENVNTLINVVLVFRLSELVEERSTILTYKDIKIVDLEKFIIEDSYENYIRSIDSELKYKKKITPKIVTDNQVIIAAKKKSYKGLSRYAVRLQLEWADLDAYEWTIDWRKTKIQSMYNKSEFILDRKNMKLREEKPLDISIFNENLKSEGTLDCVRDYLKKLYPKISKNTIDKLGNEHGVTTNELTEFCTRYSIKMIVYEINNNNFTKVHTYLPPKHNPNYKNLIYVAYNNHLYPITNEFINKKNVTYEKVEIIKEGNKMLEKILLNGKYPGDIKNNGEEIISFIHDNIKYICNDEYQRCKLILEKFGIQDAITDDIKVSYIPNLLEKIYLKESINSFLPIGSEFNKCGFIYSVQEYDKTKQITTDDMNKSYPSCLMKLPYLIKCDYKMDKITKNATKIIDEYLYIVDPKESSILLPNLDTYTGYHIKRAQEEGLEFKILEEITTTKVTNYLTNMVNDLYEKVTNNEFKDMMVKYIGKFECSAEIKKKLKINKIGNIEEVSCNSDDKLISRINKSKYYMQLEDTEYISYIYNKKPIAIQIKDEARWSIYQRMKELKLKNSDIIQIKTDSITYYKSNIALKVNYDTYLGGWKKLEEFKKMEAHEVNKKESLSFYPTKIINELANKVFIERMQSTIYDCYAGCGKTYKIINEIIPTLEKKKLSYIVLTPSHCANEEYLQAKKNCKVIQTYDYNKNIPTEDIIILDEHGMISAKGWETVYRCHLKGKIIYSFGDFKQLLPPNCSKQTPYNAEQFINLIFDKVIKSKENWRNNFTSDYYDNILNGKYDNIKEVSKYGTKNYKDAEVVICYRNKTVKQYNELLMKEYGYESKFEVGVELRCITNKSKKLREYEMFNNFRASIIKIKDNIYTLSDNNDYTKKEISKYFMPNYATTVYGVQGKTLNSYYYAKEDEKFLLENRVAYTVISRLKQIKN